MLLRTRMAMVVLAVAVVGCSVGDSVGTSSTSSVPSTTSTAPVTTSAIVTTTTLACDPAVATGAFDMATSAARLPSLEDPWTTDTNDSVYAEAVVEPEDFAATLGLRCSLRAVQGVGTGHEWLGLAAWTGERMGYVVLAVDRPTTPYDEAVRFDLLFEQPWGEWVADNVWAVTISSGDTVIVGVKDYFIGAVAKSFLVAFPEPPGAPPEVPAEEYAIAALEDAGMVNVGIAEQSDTEVGSIAFTTPLGNVMIATVGPTASFDPFTGYLTGETTVTDVEGIEVQTTLAGPDQFGVADVAFVCSDYGWRIESTLGSPDEPLEVATELIVTLGCPE
jgi:hypothetical protein